MELNEPFFDSLLGMTELKHNDQFFNFTVKKGHRQKCSSKFSLMETFGEKMEIPGKPTEKPWSIVGELHHDHSKEFGLIRYHKYDIEEIDNLLKAPVEPAKIYQKWKVADVENLERRPPTQSYISGRKRRNPDYRLAGENMIDSLK